MKIAFYNVWSVIAIIRAFVRNNYLIPNNIVLILSIQLTLYFSLFVFLSHDNSYHI